MEEKIHPIRKRKSAQRRLRHEIGGSQRSKTRKTRITHEKKEKGESYRFHHSTK